MQIKWTVVGTLALLLGVLGRGAEASSLSFVLESSAAEVAPGATFDVSVWLLEVIEEGEESLLFDRGLISSGVRLSYGSGASAEVLSPDDIAPNPAFDDPFGLVRTAEPGLGRAELIQQIDLLGDPVFGSAVGPLSYRLDLGVFRLTAVGVGPATITAGSLDNPFNVTDLGVDLDGLGIAEGSVSVTVIPEPSSAALLCLGVLGLTLSHAGRRRRRGGVDLS